MWRYEFGPNLRGRLAQGWATDKARPSGDGLRLSAEDARGGLSARRLSRFPCGRAFVRTGALRTETKKRSAGPAPAARLESWRWRVQRAARMATSRAAPRYFLTMSPPRNCSFLSATTATCGAAVGRFRQSRRGASFQFSISFISSTDAARGSIERLSQPSADPCARRKRVLHGKQNDHRRFAPGRNPGGGAEG